MLFHDAFSNDAQRNVRFCKGACVRQSRLFDKGHYEKKTVINHDGIFSGKKKSYVESV